MRLMGTEAQHPCRHHLLGRQEPVHHYITISFLLALTAMSRIALVVMQNVPLYAVLAVLQSVHTSAQSSQETSLCFWTPERP
jgi:hypothetical protein